jgi:hypothetical protein
MIRAAIHGRLGAVQRKTHNSKTMVTGNLAVAVGKPGEDITEWISVCVRRGRRDARGPRQK